MIKQICHYKPSITKQKKFYRRKGGEDKLDMEKRYASAGPNKHMFEMYNLSLKGGDASDEMLNLESNLNKSVTNLQNYNDINNQYQMNF